jgi:putative spermidine/putrescine transport system ATP-binding protein
MVMEPKVLLLDEPLSNLDARLRLEMRAELQRVQKETGVTMIFVTHDQIEALALADRIVVMLNGGIEQIGTPGRDLQQPGLQPSSPISSASKTSLRWRTASSRRNGLVELSSSSTAGRKGPGLASAHGDPWFRSLSRAPCAAPRLPATPANICSTRRSASIKAEVDAALPSHVPIGSTLPFDLPLAAAAPLSRYR